MTTILKELLQPEIEELIRYRHWNRLREGLAEWPAAEIADLLRELDHGDRALLFRSLEREKAARVFAHLDPGEKKELLQDLTDRETRDLLGDMEPDDRSGLLGELPAEVTRELMELLSPEDLAEVRELLGYPPESVGRLMTPRYVAIEPSWTVGEALAHVRRRGEDSETVNMVYVVDEDGKLLDDLRLRRLVLSDPARRVEEIMDHSFASLSAFEDREEAVKAIRRYDLVALPAVDSEGSLLGIVTVDDLMDVAEAEATEDIQKGAAVGPLEAGYSASSVLTLYNKRILWLLGLVVVNLASSGVIAAYEETLAGALALAFFIPLLIDSGGNTGAQSATLLIRALATGDVKIHEWGRVFVKELAVGVTLGVTLALAGVALGFFRADAQIALVVGLTMFCIIIATNLLGMALPFILDRLRLDPATASAPLITSLADVGGLMIYFFIASQVLVV